MPNSKTVRLALLGFGLGFVISLLISPHFRALASSITQQAYTLVQNNGSPLTQRTTINCTGSLTCSDAGGATVFNASGGGGGGTAGSPLAVQTSSITVTSNSETSLIGTVAGSKTIPANWFTAAGTVMEVCASGVMTTAAAAQGTVQFKLKFGSTVIAQTAAYTPTASMSNNAYDFCARLTARTVGSSGTIMATNFFPSVGTTTITTQATNLANPTPGTAVTVDTTSTQVIDFTVTFSANATNSITQTNFYMVGPGSAVTSVQGLTGAVSLFTNNAQTGTYQVLATDFSGCKTITVASGTFTITLVASGSQPANGLCVRILNYGSGVVTVAPSGQNINGAVSNLTIAAGSASAPNGLLVTSDGTNYFAQPLLGASSGGGGLLSGAAFTPINSMFGSSTNWQNSTLAARISGIAVYQYPTSWKVRMRFTAGSPVVGNMVILRTLTASTTVIDSTTVKIGGVSNPTLSSPGLVDTDAISLATDNTHDYWFLIFLTNVAANASVGVASNASGVPSGTTASAGFPAVFVAASGDATGATTIPTMSGGNFPYLVVAGIIP